MRKQSVQTQLKGKGLKLNDRRDASSMKRLPRLLFAMPVGFAGT